MLPLFVGVVVLLAVMMLARWYVSASPATLVRTTKWSAAVLLVGSGVLLVVTGRMGWTLAVLAGLAPWALRLLHMRNFYRTLRVTFQKVSGGRSGTPRSSRVETRFLRMTLDHDSGALGGEVLDGPFRGRNLTQLSFDEAMELHRQCAADTQSNQVLEAWLDRTWPDWRERPSSANASAGAAGGGAMTRDEALAVLGLQEGATREQIKTAHRRLMGRMHPDHGGSNYLAAKINQAKDMLLKD